MRHSIYVRGAAAVGRGRRLGDRPHPSILHVLALGTAFVAVVILVLITHPSTTS